MDDDQAQRRAAGGRGGGGGKGGDCLVSSVSAGMGYTMGKARQRCKGQERRGGEGRGLGGS